MLAHRLLGPSGGILARQTSRAATTWASAGVPHASSSSSTSTSHQAKAQSTSPSSTSGSGTKGRSKPFRPAGSVPRARAPVSPRQVSLGGNFFTSSLSSSRRSTTPDLAADADADADAPSIPKTTGRRRPRYSQPSRRSSGPSSDVHAHIFQQCQIPSAEGYSFRPIPLWPLPLTIHRALTPSHQPIMANLGVTRYTEPPSSSASSEPITTETLFSARAPSPVPALTRPELEPSFGTLPTGTSLTDHLRVTSALSHPALAHHLATPSTSASASASSGFPGEEPETYLMRVLAEADVKHQLSAEWAFESVLAKLGDKESTVTAPPGSKTDTDSPFVAAGTSMSPAAKALANNEGEKERMAEALKGLEGVLERLEIGEADIENIKAKGKEMMESAGLGKGIVVEVKVIRLGDLDGEGAIEVEDLGVMLDSVKRKRKKKITKHKYQKRRKATRAQRKRLGK